MDSKLMHSALTRETQEALGVFATLTSHSAWSPELMLLALVRVGDALRLGMPVALSIGQQLSSQEPALLMQALLGLAEEIQNLPLPETPVPGPQALSLVVVRRDQIESVERALDWMSRGRVHPMRVRGALAKVQALAERLDKKMSGWWSRPQVEQRLGGRVVLQGTKSWSTRFAMPAPELSPVPTEPAVPSLPPPELTAQQQLDYIISGEGYALLEEATLRTPDFGRQLAFRIDGRLVTGEPVGFAARRWRKRCGVPVGPDPWRLAVLPAVAVASNPDDPPPSQTRASVDLGRLAPLPIQVRLVVTPTVLRFFLYPEQPEVIAQLELGEQKALAPEGPEPWTVAVQVSDYPLRLSVKSKDGTEVREYLRFAKRAEVRTVVVEERA